MTVSVSMHTGEGNDSKFTVRVTSTDHITNMKLLC